MTRAEFVKNLSLKLGETYTRTDDILKTVMEEILHAAEDEGKICVLRGVTFKKASYGPRKCRNPQTGESFQSEGFDAIVMRKRV
ncbi:MAG: HU family DNA-binding protein [Mailhella sp.]